MDAPYIPVKESSRRPGNRTPADCGSAWLRYIFGIHSNHRILVHEQTVNQKKPAERAVRAGPSSVSPVRGPIASTRFLRRLRAGGRSNMYGAIPYLMHAFALDRETAFRVVCEWVDSRAADVLQSGPQASPPG